MTDVAGQDREGRKAKARLTNMLTQQVGIVDRPANERPFLIQKSASANEDSMPGETKPVKKDEGMGIDPTSDTQASAPPPAPVAEAAPPVATISLPAAAKQALSAGLATLLTQASQVVSMIQNATIDDTAQVPPDLLGTIDQMADSLDALSDSYDPEMAMSAKSFGDNYKDGANPGGGEGSATPQKDPPPLGSNYVEKGAGAGAPPADVKPPAPGSGPPMPRKTRKLIAKGRMSKLDEAYGTIGKGATMLKAVMSELKGESNDLPAAPPPPVPAKPQGTEKTAAAAPIVVDFSGLEKILAPLAATVRDQGVKLDAIAKSAGVSRAAPNDGGSGGAPPPTKKPAFRGNDFNKQIEEEEREERERAKATAGK